MLGDFDPTNVTGKYVLDAEGEPVEERDLLAWARWMETREHVVLQTYVGDARVSTIFLGLDYSFHRPITTPVLWETMVFGQRSAFDGWCRRYTSKLDALAGHVKMCELVERFDAPAQPRRLKKALRKYAAKCPLHHGEALAVRRWAYRVDMFAFGRTL